MWKPWLAAIAAATSLSSGGALAQTPGTEMGPDTPKATRDPVTLAALDKMGAALRRLDSFSVRSDVTEEKVLTTGQKIQFSGMVEAKARRPDKLQVHKVSDRQERIFYFDGQKMTLYSPRLGFYASAPAQGSIRQAVSAVADKYNIETPLGDLFAWGEDPAGVQRIQSAFYVGAETIGGFACDQYAMRETGTDWQVWIRQKGEALPCKLVITSTDQPGMPQYSSVFTWTAHQDLPASTFTFVPPKDSHKITLLDSSVDTTPAN